MAVAAVDVVGYLPGPAAKVHPQLSRMLPVTPQLVHKLGRVSSNHDMMESEPCTEAVCMIVYLGSWDYGGHL
jgi:hypothetical protein